MTLLSLGGSVLPVEEYEQEFGEKPLFNTHEAFKEIDETCEKIKRDLIRRGLYD
jgi:hypothetical protein